MEPAGFATQRMQDLFRQQVQLCLRMHGANWTLRNLRTPAFEHFLLAGYSREEPLENGGHLVSVGEIATCLRKRPSQVMAYAHAAGLKVREGAEPVVQGLRRTPREASRTPRRGGSPCSSGISSPGHESGRRGRSAVLSPSPSPSPASEVVAVSFEEADGSSDDGQDAESLPNQG